MRSRRFPEADPPTSFTSSKRCRTVALELGFDEAQARALTLHTFAGAAQLAMQSHESARGVARESDFEGRHDRSRARELRARQGR